MEQDLVVEEQEQEEVWVVAHQRKGDDNMAGDVKSRYEIVSELANNKIELITELGRYKSKEATMKSEVEQEKVQQKRDLEKLKGDIGSAILKNHSGAKQKRFLLEKIVKQQLVEVQQLRSQLESLEVTQKEIVDNETNFINLLENDKNTSTNHAREVEQTTKTHAEEQEDSGIELAVNLEVNEQSINDIGEKIKAIDQALEAIKSISANNEKSKE